MSKEDFDAIDTDGDGYITASEMLSSLGSDVSDDDIATIVTMADQDGDQKISYEEYAKFAR
ncbi:MAG TPA: EF-hand domain-containing protein [Solirubrobacteraceae bacterium]|jgi:calmodulin|nr:EF-hand domain-containing protein [Solirubrobacteraceae bacterium]